MRTHWIPIYSVAARNLWSSRTAKLKKNEGFVLQLKDWFV